MSVNKRKGTAWESAVVAFLQGDGWENCERRALRGTLDAGDIAGLPGVVLECKATGVMQMGAAVAEAEKEQKNAKARWHAVVFKRRQKPAGDAYVITSLSEYSEMLQILEAHGYLR
jgi:hypothetical protein